MMKRINGEPAEELFCGDNARLYLYSGHPARLATVWDYLNDASSASTRPDRDFVAWSGNASVSPGIVLTKIEARYRMNAMWILFHMQHPRQDMAGRKVTFYIYDDKSKPLRKFASKRLSFAEDSFVDSLLLRLVWSEEITLDSGNMIEQEGGSIVAIRASSRDMRKIYFAGIEMDNAIHFIRDLAANTDK